MTKRKTWLTDVKHLLVTVAEWHGKTTCSTGKLQATIRYKEDAGIYRLTVYDPIGVVRSNYGDYKTLLGAKRGATTYTGSKWTWEPVEPNE
jgi:hypothetical protein